MINSYISHYCAMIFLYIHNDNVLPFYFIVTCPLLTSPNNGMINCLLGGDGVPNPGETCTVTCDNNYQLITNGSRTCLNNGSWSGSDALCRRGEWYITHIM